MGVTEDAWSHRENSFILETVIIQVVIYFCCCRFVQREVAAELYEGELAGTIVKHLEARSTSSLQFEIIRGNTDNRFSINPSTGVVTTNWALDYETVRLYNLSVTATNMVSTKPLFTLKYSYTLSKTICRSNFPPNVQTLIINMSAEFTELHL